MELRKIDNVLFSIARQGNDKNGNPIYIINIFEPCEAGYYNVNFKIKSFKKDKYNNIKVSSYDITNVELEHNGTIRRLLTDIYTYNN